MDELKITREHRRGEPMSERVRRLTRESGGYRTFNAEGNAAPRQIQLLISPAATTAQACVIQTFTVPEVLAADWVSFVGPSTVSAISGTSNVGVALARVSAASSIDIGFGDFATSAVTPTSSLTWTFWIYSTRGAAST